MFVEQKLGKEWDFYLYNNLRFIWEIDGENNRSILHLKEKNNDLKEDGVLEEKVSERYKVCKEYLEFNDVELQRKWSN